MKIYRFRPDMVFDVEIEVPEGTNIIPRYHTFQAPPNIPEGSYAIMAGGWRIVEGIKPEYPVPPTPEEYADMLFQEISVQTQKRLDDFAKTRNYDGILSACTYSNSSVERFRIEGQYCVDVRDATWARLYYMLAEVLGNVRPMPSGYSDIESELPTLTWPN